MNDLADPDDHPHPAPADGGVPRAAMLDTLREVFGYDGLRPGQEEVLDAVMAGENVLAVMPTGAGKSMCYQLPALVRGGLTVVVSPLIALMRDQVAALRAAGVSAGTLNSSTDPEERRRIAEAMAAGRLRLLYLSPERLAASSETRAMLREADVRLLAIDEAHCVSQWGHDFRPEYTALAPVRRELGDCQTIALTATADKATRDDIARSLFDDPPTVLVQGFDRPNLRLAMRPKASPRKQIRQFLERRPGLSGIVYCNSRRLTEELSIDMAEAGRVALPYHAGMEKTDRERTQDRFLNEDGVVVFATVAFGMGIDKPDVRFVCHAGLPKSIESYYQEIGRAGRDGLPADTLTLYGMDDVRLRRMQIDEADSSDEQKRLERQRLNALVALCEAPRCRRQTLLGYFGETVEPCGNCDLCLDKVETVDGTVEAQKALSAILRTGERFGMEHLIDLLRGDVTEKIARFGHDRLPTFGVGADRTRQQWRTIFRQLYALGIARFDPAEHGAWHMAEAGRPVLKGEERVQLRLDPMTGGGRSKRRRAAATEALPQDVDADLLAALKTRRSALAREQGVPAYVVFPDRTLIEMAAAKPATLDQMGGLHGIGARKLERYGEIFLEVING